MKSKRLIKILLGIACSVTFLSGCAARALENEINVVFLNEGQIVDKGVVTQFKNIKSPTLSSAYVPTDYRFLGWTCYSFNELDLSSATNFKKQYIAGGRMVHYMEVAKFAKNQTVTCEALIMHKDDIPKDYHYAVVAWYDKAGTSGLNQAKIDGFATMLNNHLAAQGVSEEDIKSVVVRGYSGNVGPTTGQILFDDDVDIMLGWGSVSNITTTGSIPESMIRESKEFPVTYNGEVKNRYIHRISDNAGGVQVFEYLQSEEVATYFNS